MVPRLQSPANAYAKGENCGTHKDHYVNLELFEPSQPLAIRALKAGSPAGTPTPGLPGVRPPSLSAIDSPARSLCQPPFLNLFSYRVFGRFSGRVWGWIFGLRDRNCPGTPPGWKTGKIRFFWRFMRAPARLYFADGNVQLLRGHVFHGPFRGGMLHFLPDWSVGGAEGPEEVGFWHWTPMEPVVARSSLDDRTIRENGAFADRALPFRAGLSDGGRTLRPSPALHKFEPLAGNAVGPASGVGGGAVRAAPASTAPVRCASIMGVQGGVGKPGEVREGFAFMPGRLRALGAARVPCLGLGLLGRRPGSIALTALILACSGPVEDPSPVDTTTSTAAAPMCKEVPEGCTCLLLDCTDVRPPKP